MILRISLIFIRARMAVRLFSCVCSPFTKSAVKTVLFQPLSMIEFEADYRPMSNLYRIKEAKSWYPFRTLPYDPYKSSIAMFLAEFLYRALREEAENGPLFAYLEHSIRWLDECDRSFSNFSLVF